MASEFLPLFGDLEEIKAIIAPGWKLHFYDFGTTTPLPVYADSGETLQHANPVKVDRFGAFPEIFLDDAETYTFVIENEFGVEKFVGTYPTAPRIVPYKIDPVIKTSAFTVEPNVSYRTDTTAGGFTITVPANWPDYARFMLHDANASWNDVNPITIDFGTDGYNYYSLGGQVFTGNVPSDNPEFISYGSTIGFELW